MEYKASTAEKELAIVNLYELENEAKALMTPGAFGYIQGGAGDELTMRRNDEAFKKCWIVPRVLADTEKPELASSLLGIAIKTPIIMSPSAAHGLAHVEGEKATARGVAEAGSIMSISTYANTTIEETAAAGNGAPQFFQLYMSKDDGFNDFLIDKAVSCGVKAIILTADATVGGNREDDVRTNFTFPLPMPNLAAYGSGKGENIAAIYAKALQKIRPADVEKIAARSKLPVIVKGIQSPGDATLAIGCGASAVFISNHGGRQLDGGPGSFDVLKSIVQEVAGRVPIIFDSGVRRGQHAFKALALGATAVGINRPVLYALTLGGSKGVLSVFKHINAELEIVMQLAGCKTIADIKKAKLLPSN